MDEQTKKMASEMLDRFFEHLSNISETSNRQKALAGAISVLTEELEQEKRHPQAQELEEKLRSIFNSRKSSFTSFEESVRLFWAWENANNMHQDYATKDWADLLYNGYVGYDKMPWHEVMDELADWYEMMMEDQDVLIDNYVAYLKEN